MAGSNVAFQIEKNIDTELKKTLKVFILGNEHTNQKKLQYSEFFSVISKNTREDSRRITVQHRNIPKNRLDNKSSIKKTKSSCSWRNILNSRW